MPLVSVILVLIVIGILLWLVNSQLGQFMSPPIVKIINVLVGIVVILWLLQVFGLLGPIQSVRIGSQP